MGVVIFGRNWINWAVSFAGKFDSKAFLTHSHRSDPCFTCQKTTMPWILDPDYVGWNSSVSGSVILSDSYFFRVRKNNKY
jgi:hypothetical protein